MARVVHFEIHAEQPERAAAFYQAIFGWEIRRFGEHPYWLITTGAEGTPGINGGLMLRRGPAPAEGQPVNAYVCTVQVDDLDGDLAKVQQHGGTLAVPRMPIPGVGWLAYCKDPEGNLFGLTQPDRTAA